MTTAIAFLAVLRLAVAQSPPASIDWRPLAHIVDSAIAAGAAPGGVVAMDNDYRPDVFERYANTMHEVFGHEPCFDGGRQGAGPRRQP